MMLMRQFYLLNKGENSLDRPSGLYRNKQINMLFALLSGINMFPLHIEGTS